MFFPNKTLLVFSFFFLFASVVSAQQHPLVGTWEFVSGSGINAEGEKFYLDSSTVREIKIITPTHYILIAHDVVDDSLVFNRAYAGSIEIKGSNYTETPIMSSLQIVENLKTDFTWKVERDLFTQSGKIIRPDGKKVIVDKLVFRRAKPTDSNTANPAIGTWNYLSSTSTSQGETRVEKSPEIKVLEIITPSHWMGISYRNNKFENAMGGTYKFSNNTMYPSIDYSALAIKKQKSLEIKVIPENSKMIFKGTATSWNGQKSSWEDVCERVK